MTAPTMTTEAAAYLAAVEHELADLPADERAELLEDLAMHLQAVEEEHDERPLEVRLGSAVAYASELRTAAGLPPRATPRGARVERLTSTLASWSQHRWVAAVRALLAGAATRLVGAARLPGDPRAVRAQQRRSQLLSSFDGQPMSFGRRATTSPVPPRSTATG